MAQPFQVDTQAMTWKPFERCAWCACEILVDKHGVAITPVAGVEHLCGVNCACRDEGQGADS